ncbi:MAG: ribosome biogenesis GTPase Der [Bacteroidetes bacterium HGW-Bacteroidetes-17]|jgi:GTP-binding protein|nr:MAG: ribosome biogenesis GTPase Der [Bacteroidetes bacterium HGW-Bacteroidetes-17]
MGNILGIVGRPNVGKSTLFNKLTESREAIVEETSGVTRDRHYGQSNWNGVKFLVIDTGGYVIGSDDIFEEEIRKQVDLAINESDVIAFLVDIMDGVMPMDEDVANLLRKSKKKVILVANKVDNHQRAQQAHDFYQLGLGEVFCISSINGSGTGDLLDAIVSAFPEKTTEDEVEHEIPWYAVIGRPNVGKSSFINALIGVDRNIVTPIAGTTRDTINTRYSSFGFDFMFVDTAGLRKKAKVTENIEFYSVMRSIRAIEKSDVCLLMLDAKEGIEGQDLNIFHLAEKNHKGIVIIVNKWDLVEKESNTHLEFEKKIREKIAPFNDVPIIFTSVLTKQRIFKALELAHKVYKNKSTKITTSKLNDLFLPLIEATPPPTGSRGKYIKFKYVTQLPTNFPAFAFFCNFPSEVKESYRRFLENKLRENFDFEGVPIEVYFRQK